MLSSNKGNFLKSSFFFLLFLTVLIYLGYVDYKILTGTNDLSFVFFSKIHENLKNSNTDTILIVLTLFMTIIPLLDGMKKMRKLGLTLKNVQFESRTELFILLETFALILLKLLGFQLASAFLFSLIAINFLVKIIRTFYITKSEQKNLIQNISVSLYDKENHTFKYEDVFIYKSYLVEMFRYSEKNEFALCLNSMDNILTTFFFDSYGINYKGELFQQPFNMLLKSYYDIGDNHINLLKLIRKLAYAFYSNENFMPKHDFTYFDYYDFEQMLVDIKSRLLIITGRKYTTQNKAFYQNVNVLMHEIMTVFMIEGIRFKQAKGTVEVLRDFFVGNLNESCSIGSCVNLYISSFCVSFFTLIMDRHYYTDVDDIEHIIKALDVLVTPINLADLDGSVQHWHEHKLNILEAHDIACVYDLEFFIDKTKIYSDIDYYKNKMQFLIDAELNMKKIIYSLVVEKR